jgi:hypothetical protein
MENEHCNSRDTQTLQEFVHKFNALASVFESMPTGVFAILDKNINLPQSIEQPVRFWEPKLMRSWARTHRIFLKTGFPASNKWFRKLSLAGDQSRISTSK